MKRGKFLILFVLIFIFLMPFISAFQLGNGTNIRDFYSPGESISGLINISFQDDENLMLKSNFGGGISLLDFLYKNFASYSCIPSDCQSSYNYNNPDTTSSFSMTYGDEELVGFVVFGDINEISELRFNMSIANGNSCLNPLKIDILDNGEIEWKAYTSTSDFSCVYEERTGCYDDSESGIEEVDITQTPYCEQLKLPIGNKFRIGAWIKKGNDAYYSSLLTMHLYDLDGFEIASCNLPEPSTNGGEIGCEINYDNDNIEDYYVCVSASESIDYTIRKEVENSCGFYGEPPANFAADYYIFSEAAKFGSVGSISFDQTEYSQQNFDSLSEKIDDYIFWKYWGNCTSGCVIPFRFMSGTSIDVNISNIYLGYSTTEGATSTNQIYKIVKSPIKINSDPELLDLIYANISAPSISGSKTFTLYLGDEEVLEEDVFIEQAPIIRNVFPTGVSVATQTNFIAEVEKIENSSIISYNWDFGDGSIGETTSTNSVSHIYEDYGIYTLSLEVEDSAGRVGVKNFNINVGSPQQAINTTIRKYKNRIQNITSSIASMPSWYKTVLENKINLDVLNSNIRSLERSYNMATSDAELLDVMANLTLLEVPHRIGESLSGEIPAIVDYEDVMIPYLEDMGAGSYDIEATYQRAVVSWMANNELKIDYNVISAYYDNRVETLISLIKVKVKPVEDSSRQSYLVIRNKDIVFKDAQKTREFADSFGVIFPDLQEREIEFVISEDLLPTETVIYFSPEFADLEIEALIEACNFNKVCEKDLGENSKNCRNDCKPWGTALILILIVVFIGLGTYIGLDQWYKRKYESYLFKSRNSLYNIMNFIKNAKNQKIEIDEIRKRLKKERWKKEQINYVIKKVEGRRVAMPVDLIGLIRKVKEIKIKKQVEKELKTSIPKKAGIGYRGPRREDLKKPLPYK